jgi:hypothetical protein
VSLGLPRPCPRLLDGGHRTRTFPGSEIEGWFATVERPSSVGPPISVCGTEDWRIVLRARMGKEVLDVKRIPGGPFMDR